MISAYFIDFITLHCIIRIMLCSVARFFPVDYDYVIENISTRFWEKNGLKTKRIFYHFLNCLKKNWHPIFFNNFQNGQKHEQSTERNLSESPAICHEIWKKFKNVVLFVCSIRPKYTIKTSSRNRWSRKKVEEINMKKKKLRISFVWKCIFTNSTICTSNVRCFVKSL